MSSTDYQISAFTHKIADLPDQPNLSPSELKARFDACPEELRVAHNALCEDTARLGSRVDGIVAETFGDSISRSMLANELAAEIDGKATQEQLNDAVYLGRYTGNGLFPRSIFLGFAPKMVFIMRADGIVNSTADTNLFLALPVEEPGVKDFCVITSDGFSLRNEDSRSILNSNNREYVYVALR